MIKINLGLVNISSIIGSTETEDKVTMHLRQVYLVSLKVLQLRWQIELSKLCFSGYIQTEMTDKLSEQQKNLILKKFQLKELVNEDVSNVYFLSSFGSIYYGSKYSRKWWDADALTWCEKLKF